MRLVGKCMFTTNERIIVDAVKEVSIKLWNISVALTASGVHIPDVLWRCKQGKIPFPCLLSPVQLATFRAFHGQSRHRCCRRRLPQKRSLNCAKKKTTRNYLLHCVPSLIISLPSAQLCARPRSRLRQWEEEE